MMISTDYDPEADVLTIVLAPPQVASVRTKEVAPGITLDFDAADQVIGIEVLSIRPRWAAAARRVGMDVALPAGE